MVIVCVSPDAALSAARSALAARLISVVGAVEASCRRPMRSWPDASCTAPSVAEVARAAKITLKICDMTVCPSPHGDQGLNPNRAAGGPAVLDHLTVFEKKRKIFSAPWNDFGGLGVIPAAGYSPCPIDRRRRVRPW